MGLSTKFSNTLPIHREDVPLSTILDFRQRRRDQLLNFRQLLDEFQVDLRKCQEEADARQVVVAFAEKAARGDLWN